MKKGGIHIEKVIVIAGLTASGKSSLGINLAKRLNGEIISADSVAVYRNLDIGSAKPSLKEQDGVVHHMIDILDIDEAFNVALFQEKARALISDIHSRGKMPIVVGGTGLYINALLYDYRFEEETEPIEELEGSNEELYQQLLMQDPETAKSIHPNNRKRVVRALQRVEEPEVQFDRNQALYDGLVFFLQGDREKMYDRINRRVDIMVKNGLLDEVSKLYQEDPQFFEYQSTQSIGYREFKPYFTDEMTLNEVIELIKRNTRRFAKRQITWFKHQTKCIHMDIFSEDFNHKVDEAIQNWIKK